MKAGVKWEATAQTQGTFRIGYSVKDMWLPGLQDTKGTTWEGAIRWSPLSYSHVDLSTGRSFNDPLAGGNAIINSYYNASWTHDWTDRITSKVSGGLIGDSYNGTARRDTTKSLGLGLSYAMQRWLSFGADYTHTVRDSNTDPFQVPRSIPILKSC